MSTTKKKAPTNQVIFDTLSKLRGDIQRLSESMDDMSLKLSGGVQMSPSTGDLSEDSCPEAEMPMVETPVSVSDDWKCVYAKVPGNGHLVGDNAPCQDTAYATVEDMRIGIVCDGAGSAENSHLGSKMITDTALTTLFAQKDLDLGFLDEEAPVVGDSEIRSLAERILKACDRAVLLKSEEMGVSPKSFQSTFLMALVGYQGIFWMGVGDSSFVIERDSELELVHHSFKLKNPNVTEFVNGSTSRDDLRCGHLSVEGVTGLALFSDGLDSKLIERSSGRVGGIVSKLLTQLRGEMLDRKGLGHFLVDSELWKMERDDRSMALLAR